MKRIHCLGILVLDALSGPLDRYPVPRERVQSVTKTIRFAAGGGAANTAGALARMGLPACVFSIVGDGLAGDVVRRELQQMGVCHDARDALRVPRVRAKADCSADRRNHAIDGSRWPAGWESPLRLRILAP